MRTHTSAIKSSMSEGRREARGLWISVRRVAASWCEISEPRLRPSKEWASLSIERLLLSECFLFISSNVVIPCDFAISQCLWWSIRSFMSLRISFSNDLGNMFRALPWVCKSDEITSASTFVCLEASFTKYLFCFSQSASHLLVV